MTYSVFAGRLATKTAENGIEALDSQEAYTESAIGLLHRAISADWNDLEHIQEDAELDAIRGGSEFAELLKMIRSLQ